MLIWQADNEVHGLVESVKNKYHLPRLQAASIAVVFSDAKPFIGDRFNWGKLQKFSPLAKLFQPKKYDFVLNLSGDAWLSILNGIQREAWVDLHVSRCWVEYEQVIIEENGKKRPAKDEWGRIQYTDQIKFDEDGEPRWKILPLDLSVYQDNVSRYGCWCADLSNLKEAINKKEVTND